MSSPSRDAEGQKLRRAVSLQSPTKRVRNRKRSGGTTLCGSFSAPFFALDRPSVKHITSSGGSLIAAFLVPLLTPRNFLRQVRTGGGGHELRYACEHDAGVYSYESRAWVCAVGASVVHHDTSENERGQEGALPNDGSAEECFCAPPTSRRMAQHVRASTSGHEKQKKRSSSSPAATIGTPRTSAQARRKIPAEKDRPRKPWTVWRWWTWRWWTWRCPVEWQILDQAHGRVAPERVEEAHAARHRGRRRHGRGVKNWIVYLMSERLQSQEHSKLTSSDKQTPCNMLRRDTLPPEKKVSGFVLTSVVEILNPDGRATVLRVTNSRKYMKQRGRHHTLPPAPHRASRPKRLGECMIWKPVWDAQLVLSTIAWCSAHLFCPENRRSIKL